MHRIPGRDKRCRGLSSPKAHLLDLASAGMSYERTGQSNAEGRGSQTFAQASGWSRKGKVVANRAR